MKIKKIDKKLSLRKKTIVNLDMTDLNHVRGGNDLIADASKVDTECDCAIIDPNPSNPSRCDVICAPLTVYNVCHSGIICH